jgi:hypothetical protein
MTTTEPTTNVRETDPQPDEGDPVAVELVRTGWVRFRWDGQLVRLRRPFFGELKALRLSLEDVADQIGERSDELQALAQEIVAESERNDTDDDRDEDERRRVRRELTRKSKVAGRELTDFCDAARVGWWRSVVDLVGVDGELPDDDKLPSWIGDPQLPNTVLQHWRSVPLGRG